MATATVSATKLRPLGDGKVESGVLHGNLIMYGTGDPIAALKKVGHLVRSVHCKDAKWAAPDQRGKGWGTEVALGDGDVGMETYLRTLLSLGYTGPLTIEREIAHDRARQKADIGQAVRLLESLRTKIGV